MEAPNSASLGAMGSVLRVLNEPLSTDEEGEKELRRDLVIISTNLKTLSKVHDPPLTVNYWMKDARELSYEMEDFVDQFVHSGGRADEVDSVEQISGFKARAKEVIGRYDRYKLDQYVRNPPTDTVGSHRLGKVYGEPEHVVPVGMEGLTKKLIEWVKLKEDGEDDQQLKVVSVLGADGVGKSTLAKKLWRESEGKFECRAFVKTAKIPDTRMILRSILSQVRPKQPLEACKVPNLIHDLRKHLQDKRYFIVIDDLWAISVWDIVRRAFPDGNCCSRIVTTTTVEDVAQACCSYDRNNIVTIKPLSDGQSKKLCVTRNVGSGKEFPQQFNACSDEITIKCGGLPLAIICIATLVASQPETEQYLDYVNKFLRNNLRINSTSVEIMDKVLKLCYSSLPHCLKTCLLYLSVYPENYLILKEDLVKQWVAEGFICTTEGKDVIDVASSYFDELVSLGLIQLMDMDCKEEEEEASRNKELLSYVLHPSVFDFITWKSMEDNFITIIDYSQSTVTLTEKIRRLSLHFGSATYATTPTNIDLSQVRSLAFMGLLNLLPSLGEFKLVRVMILHLHGDDGDTEFSLAEICELPVLRYLQVRCNVTVKLPAQMKCLKQLETMDINAGVEDVPSDIFHHPSLLHVRLGRQTKHKHLTDHLSPVTSSKAIFSDDLSRAPSPAIQVFQLLPPICSFSRLPTWIKQLHGLRIMEVVVRELGPHDPDFLADLPALTDLSLCVRKSTAKMVVTFGGGKFRALEYLKLVSGVLLLSFEEKAMPNLQRLEIGFNAHREKYPHMLAGIQNLLKLQEVAASIGIATGAEESDRIAAKSALQDAISKHPCTPSFEVMKTVDPVDEEYDTSSEIQNWIPEEPKPPNELELLKYSEQVDSAAARPQSQKVIWSRPGPTGETGISALSGMVYAVMSKPGAVPFGRSFLEYELSKMANEIQHCEFHDDPGSQTRAWLTRVREVVYDVEDWVDLFVARVDSVAGKNNSSFKLNELNRIELNELKKRIIELITEARHNIPFPAEPGPVDLRRAAPFVDPDSLIGLDGPMEEVAKMVTDAYDKATLKIVSIVGMAGSGKTTIAAAVYGRLGEQNFFQSRAFISLGQKPDMVSTLKDMLSQLGDGHLGSEVFDQLFDRLTESLHKKRYLIVVDDLWSRKDWEKIKGCFPENNLGSRIIITTRNDALALNYVSPSSRCVYKTGLLSDADSKNLFIKKLFGTKHGCPEDSEDFSAQVMRRCGGLPLALVSIAAVLADKPMDEWERLAGLNFLSTSDGNDMRQILNLSYNDLPQGLKNCMLYLSIFPENYEVDIEGLVRRWIVEGFIGSRYMEESATSYETDRYMKERARSYERDRYMEERAIIFYERTSDKEERARGYIDGLICRNMIQPLHLNHDGFPRYCRIHPVIHAFIVCKSMEENLVTIVDDQHQDVPTNYSSVRRLSLQSSGKKDQAVERNGSMDLSHARSITVFGQASAVPRLIDLSLVRVLDLEGCEGPVCLDGLHKLLFLRYLSLRGTNVSELPETIGELRYLQTLDVRSTNVKELPSSIIRLEKLMHLLCGSAKLPWGISNMKALQTVSCAIVTISSTSIIQELSELLYLRELELICDFTEMPGHEKQVTFPDHGFQLLRQLRIRCSSPSVTFERGALPRVEVVELNFDRGHGDESSGVSGIEHLLYLRHVLLEFSQHDAGAMATVDAVKKAAAAAASPFYFRPELTVKVDGKSYYYGTEQSVNVLPSKGGPWVEQLVDRLSLFYAS